MKGYWNNPKKTEESIDAGGWMHTGDLAGTHPPPVVIIFLQLALSQRARACLFLVFDEDGFCKIVGRSKDVIIRGGENVYPREIEEFLYTHPAIEDVQVIGVPNRKVRCVLHTRPAGSALKATPPHCVMSVQYGEKVCAWIKVKDNAKARAVTAEDIHAFCKDKIAHYKVGDEPLLGHCVVKRSAHLVAVLTHVTTSAHADP